MQTVTLARNAMATRFEIVLHGEDEVRLRAAGEEALCEIEQVEAQLSLYKPTSEIARVNALAAHEPVRVNPGVFRLLERAQKLSQETDGAFDITIAPLVRCWGFMGGSGKMPDSKALGRARECVGMHLVDLDTKASSVRFLREGVMLDFGAIGKGYAIERATELLREAGITSALLHGGTSTVQAIGQPLDSTGWKVALEAPPLIKSDPLKIISLRDEALSVSAVWGRSFTEADKSYGHVIDPRSGLPVAEHLLAAVISPSATETDALSTALLVGGESAMSKLGKLRPGILTFLLLSEASEQRLVVSGSKQKDPLRENDKID